MFIYKKVGISKLYMKINLKYYVANQITKTVLLTIRVSERDKNNQMKFDAAYMIR